MEDKTWTLDHSAVQDNGKLESQVIKTDNVKSPEIQEVEGEFEAAVDEIGGGLGSEEGSGNGATGDKNVNGKKRGRGRPRKNEGGSNLTTSGGFRPPTALSPPSSMPLGKRSRGRPKGTGKLQAMASFESLFLEIQETLVGGYLDTAGGNFTPHVLEGFAGEDVVSKIKAICLKASRSVCVLTATGAVSRVTIFQTGSSSGTLTYEGWFEILTLTGSFIVSGDPGTACCKNWVLSVSLADCSGRVFGGKIAGPMIVAGPGSIQLILGSFKQNINSEIKRKVFSAGHPKFTNNLASSTMLPSQVSGMADDDENCTSPPSSPPPPPPPPVSVMSEDPAKVVPLKSDNIVAENLILNSTSFESVGPNNLLKTDAMIADSHDLKPNSLHGVGPNTFQKADTIIAENHELDSNSLNGVGPNTLQNSDLMETEHSDQNNVISENGDLDSSYLQIEAPKNFQTLPVSQPKFDEMVTPATNTSVLEMHVKD
ncbi:hypothetical protein CCACVL1_25497 [Corchorus capsularis]|uniref:AT-hook motif nuclear-localized protein n=1 Tax=Corchorus capsularis TaxID=210143 RepID=A0A1R3GJQ1_COCAP|nr:hypothetical protein CCACVL1_25497 [Corchorus capsularis]